MASESIWLEQVDEAFVQYLNNLMQLDIGGVLTKVPVTVRKPEEDYKIEIYPSITTYTYEIKQDVVRYQPSPVRIPPPLGSPITAIATFEKSAKPYSLLYQIDLWSKYQQQMNSMLELWMGSFWKDFNLPVFDMGGNKRDCYVYSNQSVVKADLLDGNTRIFHSILNTRIYVEIDPRIPESGYIILEIEGGLNG